MRKLVNFGIDWHSDWHVGIHWHFDRFTVKNTPDLVKIWVKNI